MNLVEAPQWLSINSPLPAQVNMPKILPANVVKVALFIVIQGLLFKLHSNLLSHVPLLLELGLGAILTLSFYGIGKTAGGTTVCIFMAFLSILAYCQANSDFSMLKPLTHFTNLGFLHMPLRACVFIFIWLFVLFSCGSVLGEAFFAHPKHRFLSILSSVCAVGLTVATLYAFKVIS